MTVDPLFDPEVVQQPFDYYGELRANHPVHEVVPGTFLVTRMDLIHHVVAHPDIFSSAATEFLHKGDWQVPSLRSAVPDDLAELDETPVVLATADPPDHERQRRVLAKTFSQQNIRALEPAVRELVDHALSSVEPDGGLEWMHHIAEPLPMVMVTRLLGLPDEQATNLKTLGYAMVERIGGFATEARIAELDAASLTGIEPVLNAYMEARGGSVAADDGIIATVAQAVEREELSDVEALGIFMILIAAGGESTTSLLGTAVKILAERPDLQDELRANADLIPSFVEEALRFDPPFRGHYRVTTCETLLAGETIAAGSHLLLMWPAANRDPSAFDTPDDIRLDRDNPRSHVGFGWGIHLCIGAPLARLEARVAIESLLSATRHFRLDEHVRLLSYHPSLLVRRLTALPLTLEVANASSR
jgi:cytochrome P450 family 144